VCRTITAIDRPCQCSSKAAISASKSGHEVDVGLIISLAQPLAPREALRVEVAAAASACPDIGREEVMKNRTWIVLVLTWVLIVLAPLPARAQNVFAASNWNTVHIQASVVKLLVPDGTYVINAKVSVHNLDSDPQPAVCRIIATPGGPTPPRPFALDRSEVKIDHRDGADQQSVALQGVVTFSGSPFAPSGGQIDLECTSPNGSASDGVITAIQTAGTFNIPPCTDSFRCNTYSFPP